MPAESPGKTRKLGWIKKHWKAEIEGVVTVGTSGVGAWIGSGIGIAAWGTAIAGTFPVAVVAGTVGWLATHAVIKEIDKDKD